MTTLTDNTSAFYARIFPAALRIIADHGGLPGNLCLRYICPKCEGVVSIEANTVDLLQPLSLPCTNPECPGYTLGIQPSFQAFGLVLTGPPPQITLFQSEAEAQWLSRAAGAAASAAADDTALD